MYIVYVVGHSSTEQMIFEEKKEAFEYALSVSKELGGPQVNVYKASLVATVELPTEPILVKIKKQHIVKQEKFDEVLPKIVKKYTKPPTPKPSPTIDPILKDIAEDTSIPDEGEVPMGARCELDNNMAVGKRKGPTGEFVYLCVDCMGALA